MGSERDGVRVSYYADLSGVVPFATAEEAYEHSSTRDAAWVTHLSYGTDLAELIAQVTGRPT